MWVGISGVPHLFPDSRVQFPTVDRERLEDLISSLFHRLDSQQDLIDEYNLLHERFRKEVARGDRLEREISDMYNSASPFVTYVQRKYDDLRHSNGEMSRKIADYEAELALRPGQAEEISRLIEEKSELETRLQQVITDRDREKAVQTQLLETLKTRLTAVITQSVRLQQNIKTLETQTAEDSQLINDLKDKSTRRKDRLLRTNRKLDRTVAKLKKASHALDFSVDKMARAELERDRAISDRDSLRAQLANLVSGLPL